MKQFFRLKLIVCAVLVLALSAGCMAALAEREIYVFSAEVPTPAYLAYPATTESAAMYKYQSYDKHGHATYYGDPYSQTQEVRERFQPEHSDKKSHDQEAPVQEDAKVGSFPHEHSFTEQMQTLPYLASCDCVNGDTYFYKCDSCFAAGTETYVGTTRTHCYTDMITEDPFAKPEDLAMALFKPATCTENAKYRYRCAACKELSPNDADVYELENSKGSHSFTQTIAEDRYLYSAANCQSPAKYYYSCSCGASSKDPSNVFTFGDLRSHSYTLEIADDPYFYQASNCKHGTLYYKACEVCQASSNDPAVIWESGSPVHSFTEEMALPVYLYEKASCEHPAKYFKSCSCGASSEDPAQTFEYGPVAFHVFSKKDKDSKYLYQSATCQHGDIYFLSCKNCGQSSNNPILTFVGSRNRNHSFIAEVANDWYLRDVATCEHAARYYRSCEYCGLSCKDKMNTFEFGSPCGHCYTAQIAKKDYLISKATCTEGEKYFLSCCWCGQSSNDPNLSFYKTLPLGHDFSAEIHSWYYIASWPDCIHPGLYYKSCTRCGEAGTETFVGDPPTGLHKYIAMIPSSKYLARKADCTHPAAYYYSCICCGEKCKYMTFEYGKARGHDWSEYIGDGTGRHVSFCERCDAERAIKCKLIDYDANGNHSSICVVCGNDLHASDLAILNANTKTKSRLSSWTKIRVQGKNFPVTAEPDVGDAIYVMSVGCVRNEKIVKLSNPMEIDVHCPVSVDFDLYELDELGNETQIPYTMSENGNMQFTASTSTLFMFRSK